MRRIAVLAASIGLCGSPIVAQAYDASKDVTGTLGHETFVIAQATDGGTTTAPAQTETPTSPPDTPAATPGTPTESATPPADQPAGTGASETQATNPPAEGEAAPGEAAEAEKKPWWQFW